MQILPSGLREILQRLRALEAQTDTLQSVIDQKAEPDKAAAELFKTLRKEASDLDKITIGGTWGTATSILTKGELKPINDIVHKYVSPVTSTIKEKDLLMANYVMKYFNLLIKQIIEMDKILSKKAKIAYVVGNSRIKGTYVETDNILMQIIKDLELGYKKAKVNRFRKRNSGKDLFESIVYAEK